MGKREVKTVDREEDEEEEDFTEVAAIVVVEILDVAEIEEVEGTVTTSYGVKNVVVLSKKEEELNMGINVILADIQKHLSQKKSDLMIKSYMLSIHCSLHFQKTYKRTGQLFVEIMC